MFPFSLWDSNHPVIVASKQYTSEIRKITKDIVLRYPEEDYSSDAKNVAKESETYKDLLRKAEILRDQIKSEWKINTVIPSETVVIKVKYKKDELSTELPVIIYDLKQSEKVVSKIIGGELWKLDIGGKI